MEKTMSTVEAAKKWGVTPRRAIKLCSEGIIEGAFKNEGRWELPSDAKKPTLPLPIGISDYRLASSEYFYIDKTMRIKDFLDERPTVSLFTRPRRFGKTLNMDTLHTFFEKTKRDTSIYFNDKKIWSCGKNIENIKENTQSSFYLSRTSNVIHGKKPWRILRISFAWKHPDTENSLRTIS